MEQIAVLGNHRRIWDFGMPSFEATFFINSDGTYSVNSILKAENVRIASWGISEFTTGKPYLKFVAAGTTFDISQGGHLEIAKGFFDKHLKHLYKE